MKLSILPYHLQFRYPFGVSSNVRTHTPVVYVKISSEDFTGYGEAAIPPYLGETQESVISFLARARKIIEEYDDVEKLQEIISRVDAIDDGNNAAKAAIDIALHDLKGKMKSKPVFELLGIKSFVSKSTAHTIGIGDEKLVEQKIREADGFPVLKIKLGTPDDKKIIQLVRKYTDKPLYVDVNQGWKDEIFVLEMIHWMKEQNILLVEQPMSVSSMETMKRIKEKSVLPLIADESVKRLKDVAGVTDAFHGINIKLMKSTGLHEAKLMIDAAKQSSLKIYLGCMGESSCATTAMAHLLSHADYVDLDAPSLIVNDPFNGISYNEGKVNLNVVPGTGAETSLEF